MSIVSDREKGELRIHGVRFAAIDIKEFCRRLDRLVGPIIAAVQVNSLEVLQGKEDLEAIRKERPDATNKELIDLLVEMDNVAGFGVTTVKADDDYSDPIVLEAFNPFVAAVSGASSAFQTSWWCGAFSSILGRPLEVRNVTYDVERNLLKYQLFTRKGYDVEKSKFR